MGREEAITLSIREFRLLREIERQIHRSCAVTPPTPADLEARRRGIRPVRARVIQTGRVPTRWWWQSLEQHDPLGSLPPHYCWRSLQAALRAMSAAPMATNRPG
jgi:hypothetical protein